ncbi:MAG: pyridoxamine 5'-phosphate oxidase family protein [Desulfobacterales bacterium]|nr:pyridoxamine 5'-phosphate oxidase family protein [Desulfobacterales bacterium]
MIFGKKGNISTLDDVLKSSWENLHNGVRNFRHPFYRPTLTTMNGNKPEARTVILREFSEIDRILICHCDARTPKVSQIRDNPNVSWLFYHPKKWIQLRFSGTASVHTDDKTAESQWKKVRLPNRINYCAEKPPGSPTEKPTSGLPSFLRDKAPKLLDHPEARKNFAAIVCRFDQMDWLLLKLTGNIRAKFHWKDNRIEASWVIP